MAVGGMIGAGTYGVAWYLTSIGLPLLEAFGAGLLVASTPFRQAALVTLFNAIHRRDPVDIAFSALGVVLAYTPFSDGTQANASVGGFFRTLPFVKNFKIMSRQLANQGTGGGPWDVAFAEWRMVGEFQTAQPVRMVRVTKRGHNNEVGRWLTLESEILGRSPPEIKQRLALDVVPDEVVPVDLPEGVQLAVGQAGAQPNFGVNENGGLQFRILSKVDPTWYGRSRSIGSKFEGL
jgi:hypothetical protein